jgi:ribonucleotide reductase beta subunit family protein with ferritin-like domain
MSEVHLCDPQMLYRHWEDRQWSPFEIDLGTDRRQWGERRLEIVGVPLSTL